MLHEQMLDEIVCHKLGILAKAADLCVWDKLIHALEHPEHTLDIAFVGKYVDLTESYKSLIEALKHAGLHTRCQVNIEYIDSESIEKDGCGCLKGVDAILVPGGFGERGVEGKIATARFARERKVPYLGICLGMQLMCRHSEEGDVDCLGIFDTDVKRFISQRHEDKVPHMGWNTIARTNSGLFKGFTKEEFVYFVHSFYVPVNDCTAAVTDYIHPFSAALHKDNYYATQFHPEKSGSVGERILRNFLEL